MPQQFVDRAVNVPFVTQRQMPTIQKNQMVQNTVEMLQVQFSDEVVDVQS